MRLIKVNAPQGRGADVAEMAFSVEIEKVSLYQTESLQSDGQTETKDTIDIETSTPKGKRFIDALLAADFFNRKDFTVAVRQPRTIISDTKFHEITKPFVEPATDVLEEVWQFSQITISFVVRVSIAACFLAYGMIEQKILLIIAGLFILPLLPLLTAVSFGTRSKIWKLVGQGARAFSVVAVLLFTGGAAIAAFSEPPVRYNDFNTLLVSFLISLATGIAAGFANIDDVGQRQFIGLAATAQIALIPVWFGICAVLGFPPTDSQSEITSRAAAFFINILTILVTTFIIFTITKAANGAVSNLKES